MKSFIPLSAITTLVALALVGCDQSSPSTSTETPSSNPRMSDTNGMMRGATNMPATKSTSNMNTSKKANATGAANDATR